MLRPIFASRELGETMKLQKKKKHSIYSFFPIDKGDCECLQMVKDWKDKLMLMNPALREDAVEKAGPLICPRDKTGMSRYEIKCDNCKEIVGYCWATDASLKDFCDFHYTNWTDGELWYGCLTPNISPIDQSLTIECTCGYDTRDFRANQTLPGRVVVEKERENAQGREYGKQDSKFKVRVV